MTGPPAETQQNMLAEPVYVSGPMTGYPNFNYSAFTAACAELRGGGLTVVSPHEVEGTPGLSWGDYMRKDLALLVAAHSVVVLDGWECSRGAQLEVLIAHTLGMPVVPLAVWRAWCARDWPPGPHEASETTDRALRRRLG